MSSNNSRSKSDNTSKANHKKQSNDTKSHANGEPANRNANAWNHSKESEGNRKNAQNQHWDDSKQNKKNKQQQNQQQQQAKGNKNANKNKPKKDNKNKPIKKSAKSTKNNPSASLFRTVIQFSFYIFMLHLALLWCLYIVDVDKYHSVKDRSIRAVNATVHLLPEDVVTKGQQAIEFVRPSVEVAVVTLKGLVNDTSTALQKNPFIKYHWTNIHEISAVVGGRIAEYMRTVYKKIPIN